MYLITQKINQQESLLVKQDWEYIRSLWPALVLSKPSEKLSVIRLKDIILDSTVEFFHTMNIKLEIPDSVLMVAANLWKGDITRQSGAPPSKEEIARGLEQLREIGENNLKTYNEILDILLHALLEKNLHWRHRLLAMNFIFTVMHAEQAVPAKIVRFFLSTLISESIDDRDMSLRIMMLVFKQLKKKHIKVIF